MLEVVIDLKGSLPVQPQQVLGWSSLGNLRASKSGYDIVLARTRKRTPAATLVHSGPSIGFLSSVYPINVMYIQAIVS